MNDLKRVDRRLVPAFIALLVLLAAALAAGQIWLAAEPSSAVGTTGSQRSEPAEPVEPRLAAREKSIAVLPFAAQSASRENALLFSGGFHEGLLARLSRIHDLKVISRTSVMAFRGTTKTRHDIAIDLDVAHLLEGGVKQAGQRMVINVQLIEAATDTQLWSDRFEVEISTEDIFRIQGEIANVIATQLEATPGGGEDELSGWAPTRNLDAYRAVLSSRRYERRRDYDALQRAIRQARKAIAHDPDYADAYLALAVALTTDVNHGFRERGDTEQEIAAAIERAMAIEPDNAGAWSALGYFQSSFGLPDPERSFERSLQLDPGNAGTLVRHGNALQRAGNPERALDILLRAADLDPLSTDTLLALGQTYATLQMHERARNTFSRIREFDPGNSLGYYPVSTSWMEQGRLDQALYWLGLAQAIDPADFELAAWILFTYDNLVHYGSASGWSLWLDDSITSQPLPLAMQARHYYLNGDFELALQYANLAINLDLENRWRSETTFMRIKRDEAIANGDPVSGVALFLQRYPGFGQKPPEISTEDLQQAAHLGLLLKLAGRESEARRLLEAAIDVYEKPHAIAGPHNLTLAPLKAEALAILGRNEAALAELERVIHAGWRVNWLWSTDLNASFNGIRETAKFKELVRRLAGDIAEQRTRVMAMEADGTIAPPTPLPENGLLGR